ncbi:MAG: hypothetical protein IT260_22375 [Saprospiraceae bacterium]|nr:hypothetical protein [Saprospiraceae bacterium]
MPQPNAIQQVFNPATLRTLLRIGLFLAVGLAVTLIVVFVIRLVKKSAAGSNPTKGNGGNNGNGSNPDGTPVAPLPQNLKRLADDLKQATGWTLICNELRCDTILAIAELPDAQLIPLAAYYKSMYGATLRATFDSFYVSGCCFKDAGDVVDAKLKSIQDRVKNLNI